MQGDQKNIIANLCSGDLKNNNKCYVLDSQLSAINVFPFKGDHPDSAPTSEYGVVCH